jgi:hypothetical protein
MAYREDLSCQECLKRKVKSPMSRATKNWLLFVAYTVLVAAEASGIGALGDHSPGYITAPVMVIGIATFVAGLAKFMVELNKEAQ